MFCLQGVPGLPGAPQDEAGLMLKVQCGEAVVLKCLSCDSTWEVGVSPALGPLNLAGLSTRVMATQESKGEPQPVLSTQ